MLSASRTYRRQPSRQRRQAHAIHRKFQKLLEEVKKVLAPFEQLAFLVIDKNFWNAEYGFLTQTLKIKRQVLYAIYGSLAEKWYSTNQPVAWQATI